RALKLENTPVVVSTATKALQAQLMSSDIPLLAKSELIDATRAVVVKGRSNYICLSEAKRVDESLNQLFDGEAYIDEDTAKVDQAQLSEFIQAFEYGEWDGDFDTWEGSPPKATRIFAVNRETCSGKRCAYYQECAFFKARNNMVGSSVIIANHDLILQDLLLSSDQDGMGVLPLDKYRTVFDEAHHLPEKALKIGQRDGNL